MGLAAGCDTRYTGLIAETGQRRKPLKRRLFSPQFGFTTGLIAQSRFATSLVASANFFEFGIMRLLPNWRPHFCHLETGGNSRHFCRSSGHSEGSHMPPNRASGKRPCTLLVSITVPKL
jgi:hypothetical protein